MIYAVIRAKIEGSKVRSYHIYSKTTSNKAKLEEYAETIRKTYPDQKVAVIPREEARRIAKLDYERRKKANTPKIDCIELYKRSQKILDKQGIYDSFWRK